MLWGYKNYEIIGADYNKIYNFLLKENTGARDIEEKKDILYLKLSQEYSKKFEEFCQKNGYEFHVTNEKGLGKILKKLKKRPGLIAGFLVTLGLLAYFSNVVVDIRIQCDDKNTAEQIRQALYSEGITPGSYIPDMNFVVTERNVRRKIDDISWIGITRKGSVLIIDTVKNIPEPAPLKSRLPSNLTACEDAVIDKMEIKDGQVKYKKGDGVTKGDILVSGEVVTKKSSWVDGKEKIDTKVRYTRSIGNVYGTFERKVTFKQDFEIRKKCYTGKEENLSYFNFFSADIPLFSKIPYGYYTTDSKTKSLEIFGAKTPLGITECKLREYDFRTEKINEDTAREILGDKFYKYEQNFLKNYEIKDRKINTKMGKNSISQTVTYTLYGVISQETEFFINKSK